MSATHAMARRISGRWQRLGPVRRVFAALGLFLSLILVFSVVVIAIEIIAGYAIFQGANGLNGIKNPTPDEIERGAYLAKVGNCAACHTARGGEAMAGGKVIHTPFGAVYTSNITPDPATGIGRWSADAFYRALHEGRSSDGHLLTPAFPYTNYIHITRQDSDALYAYFMRGVAPVVQANRAHELPFPLNTQIALAVWRVLFFDRSPTPDAINKEAAYASNIKATDHNDAQNQRGAYLVHGLGHCSACHSQRNALGATVNDQLLGGALMPMQDWYAPSLLARDQAGVQHWPRADVVALLKTGIAPSASVAGPMAEVVAKSTQYWSDADLHAAAAYLQSLPESAAQPSAAPQAASDPSSTQRSSQFLRGAELFAKHCATCHGEQGQGMPLDGKVALPALAGNRAVTMHSTANLVRIILAGGYAPSTAGNPRPFGMPPFVHVLNDEDIAAVTTYIRGAWGHQAQAVSAADVLRHRKGVLP
jgi:mono/diheme cytochrome c family protein